MEAALRILLPGMLGETTFAIHPHQGKSDLLAKLPAKLRAYAAWIPETYRVVVIVDRDDEDCADLKARLDQVAYEAGLIARTLSNSSAYMVANRVAVEELEAWFFGDWDAVRAAYPRVPATIPSQAKYRKPDAIRGGTSEAFERVLQSCGYFKNGLSKVEAARAVTRSMRPARNISPSFQAFHSVMCELSSG